MAGILADPQRVERRLVTILAADVAGYSRLVGADEEGTLACLKAHRRDMIDPKITAHHGRIVKVTGDGILVEFASPVEAVRCAVEVQRGMVDRNAGTPTDKRIMFRVGINLGDIIVEAKDIYGDGVNIAARLEGLAEPGGLCISRTVRDQVRDRLPYLFEDRGEQSVKNIARPVRVFALSAAVIASVPPDVRATAGETRMAAGAPPVATNAAPPPPRLSIMVLPFATLSKDPEQEYLAEGFTNDLTTDLSRISGSFVIARNTAFTYKGKVTDVRQIGHELGIRYVLEGSIRRTGALVRINAQLVDVETGAQLWAERFDRDRSDLAAIQDEIVGRIATTLRYELIDLESSRSLRERQTNPDAVDLTMRGWSTFYRHDSREVRGEARDLFEQAVRIDDRVAAALAGLALTHAAFVSDTWSADIAEGLRLAEAAAARAPPLGPKNVEAHYAR